MDKNNMTPEREAQMREALMKWFNEWHDPNVGIVETRVKWQAAQAAWLACARALEPMVRDGEMFKWLCAKHADHDECEWFVYGAKSNDLRLEVLEAMNAALEDGNADV